MIEINEEDFATLAICAIRYCHGRETYMPDLVRSIVRPHLQDLTERNLSVLVDDCRFQKTMNMYGDESIDKPGWLKWERELQNEMNKRKKGNLKRINNVYLYQG